MGFYIRITVEGGTENGSSQEKNFKCKKRQEKIPEYENACSRHLDLSAVSSAEASSQSLPQLQLL